MATASEQRERGLRLIPNGYIGDWRLPDEDFLKTFKTTGNLTQCDLLASRNKIPREGRIHFDCDSHVYHVDGDRVPRSVTGFLHGFCANFDVGAAIAAYRRREDTNRGLTSQEMSDKEIEVLWSHNAEVQRARGRLLHAHAELFFNGFMLEEPQSPEFEQVQQIWTALAAEGLTVFRTEVSMFHVGMQMAGQADLICTDEHGSFVIVDWKRIRELRLENRYRSLQPPLEHLPDCNYYLYVLQLSLYAFILESEYGWSVGRLILGVVHPSASRARCIEVPKLQREIAALVEHEIRFGRATEAVPGEAVQFRMPVTPKPG